MTGVQTCALPILFLILSFSSFAQSKNEDNENRKKWHEEFRLKKQEFLIKNLDLSPTQAEAFFPLYWELQTKKFEIQKKNREQFHKMINSTKDYSDKEYSNMAISMAESKVKEEELNVEYIKKFQKIIPGKSLLKLQFAEMEFNKSVMQKGPRSGKNNQGKDPGKDRGSEQDVVSHHNHTDLKDQNK